MTLLDKVIAYYEATLRDTIETTEVIEILNKIKEAYDDSTKRT